MKHKKEQFPALSMDKYDLMTLKEAAKKLGLAPATLYIWCQMKKIPYFKIGRYLKFDGRDLDRFISRQRIEPLSY